jgi:hypothetical protein
MKISITSPKTRSMSSLTRQTAAACLALVTLCAWPTQSADVQFKAVAPGVYAFIGDLEGRSYENEALNANIGLVVTPAGAVLIDAMIDEINPPIIVPGHGRVTNLQTAQAQTRDILIALRQHSTKAVEAGVDISAAVKSFDAAPFKFLKHAEVWIPQLVNFTYLEIERE